MKIYQTKTLIPGFKLGKDLIGKTYVGVPHKYVDRGYNVAFENQMMDLPKEPALISKPLPDKFGRGMYFLYYYQWKPKKLTIGE